MSWDFVNHHMVSPFCNRVCLPLSLAIQQEGDSLGAMEKVCRQLTYHLSPHSRWRRQGLLKRKPQAWWVSVCVCVCACVSHYGTVCASQRVTSVSSSAAPLDAMEKSTDVSVSLFSHPLMDTVGVDSRLSFLLSHLLCLSLPFLLSRDYQNICACHYCLNCIFHFVLFCLDFTVWHTNTPTDKCRLISLRVCSCIFIHFALL